MNLGSAPTSGAGARRHVLAVLVTNRSSTPTSGVGACATKNAGESRTPIRCTVVEAACMSIVAERSLTIAGLEKALRTVDGDVLLVRARLLQRIIREDGELPASGMRVPHRKTY